MIFNVNFDKVFKKYSHNVYYTIGVKWCSMATDGWKTIRIRDDLVSRLEKVCNKPDAPFKKVSAYVDYIIKKEVGLL